MKKIKSYKIDKSLFVNEIPVEMPDMSTVASIPGHQFIIIDRSGSMYGELNNVCDTISSYVEKLPEGSTVSVGYFSSKGQYNLSVPYTLKKECGAVKKVVDSYRSTLGCTCFNEVLSKVNQQFKKDDTASLYFFTDGCHNDGPWSSVIKELEAMKDKLNMSMFVGCGYIDRDNMTEMADTTGGTFIHLERFDGFKDTLNEFGESIEDSVPGCVVKTPEGVECACCTVGKQIINLPVKDGKVSFKAAKRKNQVYYAISSSALGEETELGKNELPFRALAYTLTQHNATTVALKLLDYLGDKHLIKVLYNTYTLDEYAKAEVLLRSTAFYSKKRYIEGQEQGFLPADDALCVMDVITELSNEKNAVIYLNDDEFEYNAISRATVQKDGGKLIYPRSIEASANKLKLHEDALNVNIQVNYTAEVKLDPKDFKLTNAKEIDWDKCNLKKGCKVPVNCIRNYAIIADGKLNTPKLIVSGLSSKAAKKLEPIVSTRKGSSRVILNLSDLPLINKTYLKDTSAKKLAEKYWLSKIFGAESSVINYLIKNNLETSYAKAKLNDTELLEKYFYIKNGSYNPPKETVESTDFYNRYEFRVSFKGFSDVQAKKVIEDKILKGKDVTAREKIVADAYDTYKDMNLSELTKLLKANETKKKSLDDQIQRAKFAIMLINRGQMKEFASRENMTIDIGTSYGTVETKFEVVQKEVKL